MARRKPARPVKVAARKKSASGRKRAVSARPARRRLKPSRVRRLSRSATRPKKAKPVASIASRKRPTKATKAVQTKVVRKVAAKATAKANVKRRVVKPAPRPAVKAVHRPLVRKQKDNTAPRMTLAQKAPKPRKSPALNRERRTWAEDIVPGPPSSLDLDRTASSARSGRKDMLDKYQQHTETGPALTGGDIDADWESAYSVGDEAPGGDNPTPDQDLVDDIGHAVGLEYEDNEELKGEEKVSDRDRHRWELDPASSDDFEDR